jgi:protein-tyrosine phosphatase
MPRPRGGDWLEDEVRAWRRASVDVVLSLLTRDEVADLGLADEEELCRANGIRFLSFPIADRGTPESRESVLDLVAKVAGHLTDGQNVAIHCRQGIGRAAMIAACVLVRLGIDPETAIWRVGTARGCPVPETPDQQRWIMEFARAVMKPLPK